jgi:uncharacterized protein
MTEAAGRPFPGDVVPDAIDQPFWNACCHGRLLVYRCNVCARSLWPAGACPDHGMADMSWVEASGKGRLHTWTVVHQQYSRSFAPEPVVVAVVLLDEGPLMHTNLLRSPGESRVVGMPLRVEFSEIADGVALPVFVPDTP